MDLKPENMTINVPLMQFAMYIGIKYNARVISWGRDLYGNKAAGSRITTSWHRWNRGANALDFKPQQSADLPRMAEEARKYGYQVVVHRTTIHIEVGW